jgi:hypothetical protein
MCRFYYANLFKNVLACNLEGLQLDIDRFWEYVAKHFLVRNKAIVEPMLCLLWPHP